MISYYFVAYEYRARRTIKIYCLSKSFFTTFIEENISLATIQKSEEEMEREALKEAGVMFSSDEEDFNQGDSVLVRKKSSSNDH